MVSTTTGLIVTTFVTVVVPIPLPVRTRLTLRVTIPKDIEVVQTVPGLDVRPLSYVHIAVVISQLSP